MHPTLRIVLMSATAQFELFRSYFVDAVGGDQVSLVLHVGARRFPRTISFLDELHAADAKALRLDEGVLRRANELVGTCQRGLSERGHSRGEAELWRVPNTMINDQLKLAAAVALAAARAERCKPHIRSGEATRETGAVLIFVAGWSDILEVSDELARLGGDAECVCVPLHGEMAPEEQLAAFKPPPSGRTKIVIATNAAESSLTLPDVDVVVDCGQQKQLIHDDGGAMLLRTWICRAASEQRAGRTGRVRPGRVVRLFPRACYDGMSPVEPSQMRTQPLDNTVLQLRVTMDTESVQSVLDDMLEPPPDTHVERALTSLCARGMLVDVDSAKLTSLGALAANLPLDVATARLLGMSFALDCADAGVVLAAALSLQRHPFRDARMASSTDVGGYNTCAREAFLSKERADAGVLSDPLALVILYAEYEAHRRRRPARARGGHGHEDGGWRQPLEGAWCKERGLIPQRMRDFELAITSLRRHVCRQLRVVKPTDLAPLALGSDVRAPKLHKLRVLLLAAFPHWLLVSDGPEGGGHMRASGAATADTSASGPRDTIELCTDGTGPIDQTALDTLLPRPPLRWNGCAVEHLFASNVDAPHQARDLAFQVEWVLPELDVPRLLAVESLTMGTTLWARSPLHLECARVAAWVSWAGVEWQPVDDAKGWMCCDALTPSILAALSEVLTALATDGAPVVHASFGRPGCGLRLLNMPPVWHAQPMARALAVALFGERVRLLPVRSSHLIDFGDAPTGGEDTAGCLVQSRDLGVRLALSLAGGYKDRKIHMQTRRAGAPGGDAANGEALVKLEVHGAKALAWKCASGVFAGEKAIPPKHSPVSAVMPTTPGPMYAVASSLLVREFGGVAVGGLTVLPRSADWLLVALRCLSLAPCAPANAASCLDQAERTSWLQRADMLKTQLELASLVPQRRAAAALVTLLDEVCEAASHHAALTCLQAEEEERARLEAASAHVRARGIALDDDDNGNDDCSESAVSQEEAAAEEEIWDAADEMDGQVWSGDGAWGEEDAFEWEAEGEEAAYGEAVDEIPPRMAHLMRRSMARDGVDGDDASEDASDDDDELIGLRGEGSDSDESHDPEEGAPWRQPWALLSASERIAAEQLGWDVSSWEMPPEVAWGDLTPHEVACAYTLGYEAAIWNTTYEAGGNSTA